MSRDRYSVSVHGPEVQIEDAIRAGQELSKLLTAIARAQGYQGTQPIARVASVEFQCDGCGLRRPDRPSPDEGWTFSQGDDFCPECSRCR